MHERVGVEIEFTGLDAATVAETIQHRFGGRIVTYSDHLFDVADTSCGDFAIKLDTVLADKIADAPEAVKEMGTGLLRAAEGLVPLEITAPPVPPDDLAQLDALVVDLGAAGARGTRESAFAAYGVHLNLQVDDHSAEALRRWLLAFGLGFAWLEQAVDANLMRRLLGFAEPYPDEYVHYLCRVDYEGDLVRLIEDYVTANPTRAKALDMLPLFAHLDPERIESALPGAAVSARPALHYRLPDSRVGEAGWSLAAEWRRWLKIAALATDPDRLDALRRRFLASGLEARSPEWLQESAPWFDR